MLSLWKISLLWPATVSPGVTHGSLSGHQVDASVPLKRVTFLPYRLCAAASPCTPCLWVSTAAEASYLFLVAMLEGVDRSRVLLLWVAHFSTTSNLRKNPKTKKKPPKALDISCHENCCPYFNVREPTDYLVTRQWSFWKVFDFTEFLWIFLKSVSFMKS